MSYLDAYLDKARSELSDTMLLIYFKTIRSQVKANEKRVDVLLKYINELEYRGLRYRL